MKIQRTVIATMLLALPCLAMAKPSKDKAPTPTAEQDYRRDARMLMKKLHDKHPEKFNYLMELRESDPQAFRATMKKMLKEHKFDPKRQAEQEKLRELREDFRSAMKDYKAAARSERAQIRKQLVELAEEIFDAKQDQRRQKVDYMRKELKRLETEITERDESRDELIEEFVNKKIEAKPRGL